MKKIPSDIEDHLGYRLRRLSNHISSSFASRVEKHGISVPQWVALRVLFGHDSLPLKSLVMRIGVDQGSLSRMVDRLKERGLVLRKEDPKDRRSVAISLSKTGRQLVPRLAREADENDRAFFGKLSFKERKEFETILLTLLAQNKAASTAMALE